MAQLLFTITILQFFLLANAYAIRHKLNDDDLNELVKSVVCKEACGSSTAIDEKFFNDLNIDCDCSTFEKSNYLPLFFL